MINNSCINNIHKINTNVSFKNKFILICLFIIHWIFVITICSYNLWGNKNTDFIIFGSLLFLIITWFFYFSQCVITYYEFKILKDSNLTFDEMYNPSMNLYCNNNSITILISTIIGILFIYTFQKTLLRYNFSKYFVLIFVLVSIFYWMYYRMNEINNL
jgi:hypothetical protein